MAINFGTNNTGQDADLLEDVVNDQALLYSLTCRPCIQFLFGELANPGADVNLAGGLDKPPGIPNFSQMRNWGGRGKRLRLGTEEGTWEDLANTSAAQFAGVVPVDPGTRGEAVFYYDHLHLDAWETLRTWEDAKANPKKMDSLAGEKARAIGASLATKLSLNGFHGTGSPGVDALGSWRDLVAQSGTYGGIDRSLAANVDFTAQPYTSFTVASWTLLKVYTAMSYSQEKGGMPTLMPLTRSNFVKAQDAIGAEFVPHTNDELSWIKGTFPRVGSMRIVMDADTGGAAADENTFPVLDTRYFRVMWKPMQRESGNGAGLFGVGMWERNRNYKAAMQLQADAQVQIIHIHPKVNIIVTN